jgi:hypothetical protein
MSDNGGYFTGNCDIMALALHRLTGYPLGLLSGKVLSDDEEDGHFFEHAHAVVIIDAAQEEWMDAGGICKGIPDNLYFSNPVTEVVLLPALEGDVRSAFSCGEIEEPEIEAAQNYAIKNIFGGIAPAQCAPKSSRALSL